MVMRVYAHQMRSRDDDATLVRRLQAGDERAFEAIFKRHQAPLLSYCRHMLSSQDEAEDALQQAFVKAHQALLGGTAPRELRPWLYAIARNCCLSAIAARRSTAPLEEQTAVARGTVGGGLPPRGPARARRRHRPAARGPALGAAAGRARRPPPPGDRDDRGVRGEQGQGADLSGAQLAARRPRRAQHPLPGDSRTALRRARRRTAPRALAPAPAAVRGLPRLPARARRPAPVARGRAAGRAQRRARGGDPRTRGGTRGRGARHRHAGGAGAGRGARRRAAEPPRAGAPRPATAAVGAGASAGGGTGIGTLLGGGLVTKLAVGGAVVALATAGAVTVHNREAHAAPADPSTRWPIFARRRPWARTAGNGDADRDRRLRRARPGLARASLALDGSTGPAGPTSPASLTEPSGLGSADALLTSTGSVAPSAAAPGSPAAARGERYRTESGRHGQALRGALRQHARSAARRSYAARPSSAAGPCSAGGRSCGAGRRCYAASAWHAGAPGVKRSNRNSLRSSPLAQPIVCAGAGAYPASQRRPRPELGRGRAARELHREKRSQEARKPGKPKRRRQEKPKKPGKRRKPRKRKKPRKPKKRKKPGKQEKPKKPRKPKKPGKRRRRSQGSKGSQEFEGSHGKTSASEGSDSERQKHNRPTFEVAGQS